jgi:hypothetical protein
MFLFLLFPDGISLVSLSVSLAYRLDDSHVDRSLVSNFSFPRLSTQSASRRGYFLLGSHADGWCRMSFLCGTVFLLVVYARLCHSHRYYLVLCKFRFRDLRLLSWLHFSFVVFFTSLTTYTFYRIPILPPSSLYAEQIGIASRLENPSDILLSLYGHTIVDATRYACYMLAGTLGSLLLPSIAIWLARELCVIHVVELE